MHRYPMIGDVITVDNGLPVLVVSNTWDGFDGGSVATFTTTGLDFVDKRIPDPPKYTWEIIAGIPRSKGYTRIELSRLQWISSMKLSKHDRKRVQGSLKIT